MQNTATDADWARTQRVAVYTNWYTWKQRPHQLVDVLSKHHCQVQVHSFRGLRSHGPPSPSGTRIVAQLLLPQKLERNRHIGSFIRNFNQRRCTRAIQRFVADPADVHVYANVPIELPSTKPATFVYDCMDEWAGFDNALPDIDTREQQLCEQADQIWVVSRFLENKLGGYSAKVRYVPNGVDYQHFSVVPQLRKLIRRVRPTMGYVGAIHSWFDAPLVGEIARLLPDWDILLIGPDRLPQPQRENLKVPNIRLLGEHAYASLPGLMAQMDVCIIPFALTPLIKATSPIKLYEYLAAGCPVVSTSMPEVLTMVEPGVVACADSPREFVHAAQEILNSALVSRRQEIGKSHSWESRFTAAVKGLATKNKSTTQ